jgi:ABC-2 type transport system ATP-binding protein
MTSPQDDWAIDLSHVEKKYRRGVRALRGIRMQVRRGEIFGLLGPNGAGKTTLVKIMMTVVRPTRAEGTILGRPIGHKPTLAEVGYLPENHHFPPYLTGRQALTYYAAMALVDGPTRRRRAGELLQTVGLGDRADTRIRTYSKGMQQRLGLAQSLMNGPQLIVLDEPTDGLDPVGRREVRDVLKRLRDQGHTIFLNSHLLSEVELVCDRVAILDQGKVVRQGTVDELTAIGGYYEIQVQATPSEGSRDVLLAALGCERPTPTGEAAAVMPVVKGRLPSGVPVEVEGNAVRVLTDRPHGIQAAIDGLRRRELVISSVRLVRQSLEDYFIETVTGKGPAPDAASSEKGGQP